MRPLTPDKNMRSHRARWAIDGRGCRVLHRAQSRLTPFERLEIYNRQYWYRVLGALAEDFPACAPSSGAVGLRRSASLISLSIPAGRYAAQPRLKLPAWLAAHPEHTGRRHRLAVDVAKMEWAFVEAFDCGGARSADAAADCGTLEGEIRGSACSPICSSSRSITPPTIWFSSCTAARNDRPVKPEWHTRTNPARKLRLPKLRPRPTWLAVHRVDLSVYYRRIGREEFQTLVALRSGSPLGEALDAGFVGSRIPEHKRAEHVQEWFGNWAEFGWICQG